MTKKETEKDLLGELEAAGLEPTVHEGDWPPIEQVEPPPISSLTLTKRGYIKSGNRVPPAVNGIQVNFCKNPLCGNYGVPAMAERPTKATRGQPGARYTVSGGSSGAPGSASVPVLSCKICGEYPTLKSNQGIAEELARLWSYLNETDYSCADPKCSNYGIPLSDGTAHYYRVGKTPAGSVRHKCKACGKTFSVGKAARKHKEPHKNREVFVALMNKAPFRRAAEMAGVDIRTIYDKIDFSYRQCLAFVADRERELARGKALKPLYIAVDRQDYTVNWAERHDKRNIVLHAVGSADLATGYVFGMHLNFDPAVNAPLVEAHAEAIGDTIYPAPFRTYARLWLPPDYADAVMRSAQRPVKRKGKVADDIKAEYADTDSRGDTEVSEGKTLEEKLPARGMQVHAEYTLYAHFLFLRKLLPGAEKYRFFLDQDSGMRAACLAGFYREIKARIADAFFVRINKDMTDGQKQSAVNRAKKAFKLACDSSPGLGGPEVLVELMETEMKHASSFGRWDDQWAFHPMPDKSEPEKAMCYLTDLGGLETEFEAGLSEEEQAKRELDHKARLYLKATLHPIDRYFQSVRRRLSMLERPISSASATGNRWYGYAAYRPEMIVKLLTMHRVYYNYCLAGDDKQTPAMRLGLAKAIVDPQKILYFR